MPSRTADHLYWTSRYTERAEKLAEGRLSPKCRGCAVPAVVEARGDI